jgi:hypothetical protein
MSMQNWRENSDRVKLNYWEKNLSQCHFVHRRSYRDRPGIEQGPQRLEAGDTPFTVSLYIYKDSVRTAQ